MTQNVSTRIVINDVEKVCADISKLYLNEKFSDTVLVADGVKLHAHKAILAARSKYFATLLFENEPSINEHKLAGISTDILKLFLKYIYTGTMTLDSSAISNNLKIISWANLYNLDNIRSSLTLKISEAINIFNVFSILDKANLYNLQDLINASNAFLDVHGGELKTSNSFNNLSQTSIVNLLKRDTFVLPEMDIFDIVLKWRKTNTDVDNLLVKCIRFQFMSVVDIISKIWPSKILKCEEILNIIAQIVDVKPKTGKPRAQSEVDVNFATLKYGSEVITGTNCMYILNDNKVVNRFCYQTIDGRSGITIKLGGTYLINNIVFRLYDADIRHYKYYIEASVDGVKWVKILDYTKYSCRSYQNLFIKAVVTRFIRIVGTFHTQDKVLHVVTFEAYYRTQIPKLLNNVIIPTSNVALLTQNAVLLEGTNSTKGFDLIDGVMDKSDFTYHKIGSGSIVIELAQPYVISSLRMRLYDADDRYYKYYVETSINKSDWELAVDHKNQESKSWQNLSFSERITCFIRLTGTSDLDGLDKYFHVIYLECPSTQTKT